MASIISSKIVSDRPQKDGRRYLRYQYEILDDLGHSHVRHVGPKLVPAGFDANADMTAQASRVLDNEKSAELEQYRQAILGGNNPFQTMPYRYNTREELLQSILTEAFSAPGDDPMVMRGVAFIDLVTDQELQTLFGWTVGEVVSARNKIAAVQNAIQALISYIPIFGNE